MTNAQGTSPNIRHGLDEVKRVAADRVKAAEAAMLHASRREIEDYAEEHGLTVDHGTDCDFQAAREERSLTVEWKIGARMTCSPLFSYSGYFDEQVM